MKTAVINRPVDINVLFNRPTIKGWELRQGIDAFAHTVCSALSLPNITVGWDDDVPTACINMHGNIMVQAVKDDAIINAPILQRYAGFIVHELLHRKYSDFAVVSFIRDSYLQALHNAIEDAWIERTAIASGLLGNIEGLLTGLINGYIVDSKKKKTDWSNPATYPFTLAVYAREFCDRLPVPHALLPVYEQATRMIDTAQDSRDTLKIAEWVYAQFKSADKHQQAHENNQTNPGKPCDNPTNPGDQSGDQSGDQAGNQSGEQAADQAGDQSGAAGDQSGDQSGEQTGKTGTPDASESPTGDQNGQGKGKGASQGKNAPMPKDAGTAKAPTKRTQARQVEPSASAPDGAAISGTWSSDYVIESKYHSTGPGRYPVNNVVPGKLRYEIRRLFENTAQTLFSNNRKSGAVDSNSLHKWKTTDRIFQKRTDIDGIDSAVVIVLDISGSMFDYSLISPAIDTCAALVDALQSADVSTALVFFGSRVSVAAPFGTRAQKVKSILSGVQDGGGTNDFAAVRLAHDLLRVRTESRKVCFVITDGVGNVQGTREQIASGAAFGIRTIGVGIKRNVSNTYSESVHVDSVADLARVSFAQIKKAVS